MGKEQDSPIKTKIYKKDKNIKIIEGAVPKRIEGPIPNRINDNQNLNFRFPRRINNAYRFRTSKKDP